MNPYRAAQTAASPQNGPLGGHAADVLPSHTDLDRMLDEHMARAARQFDEAVEALSDHHDRMGRAVERLYARREALEETVRAVVDEGAPLTRKAAREMLEYLAVDHRLARCLAARRAAYPATTLPRGSAPGPEAMDTDAPADPGEACPLGQALGTPRDWKTRWAAAEGAEDIPIGKPQNADKKTGGKA